MATSRRFARSAWLTALLTLAWSPFLTVTGEQSTGQIAGTVTAMHSGLPIAGVTLELTGTLGSFATAVSDSSGGYIFGSLAPDTYYLKTDNALGYIDELYDNSNCATAACVPQVGTPIVIGTGATTTVNFALAQGGAISGLVVDGATNAALDGVLVSAWDGLERPMGSVVTPASGQYSLVGLAPGTYFLTARKFGYPTGEFQPRQCTPSCGRGLVGRSTGVGVVAGATTPSINLTLTKPVAGTGGMTGVVINASTLTPVAGASVTASGGARGFSATTDANGRYTFTTLDPGTYYVTADTATLVGELYDDLPCDDAKCISATGAPVVVTASAVTSGVDFALQSGGTIYGKVIDQSAGHMLFAVRVEVLDVNGRVVSAGHTDASTSGDRNYSIPGIPDGTYYIRTRGPSNYLDEVYPDISCPTRSCGGLFGTPVVITNGTQLRIDFALAPGGLLSGFVREEGTATPIQGAGVSIYNAAGEQVAFGFTDAVGRHVAGGLGSGSYFLKAASAAHAAELYGGMACPNAKCDPRTGTAVEVTAGVETGNISFALANGGQISGTVTDAAHAGIGQVRVVVHDSAGSEVNGGSVLTSASGTYTVSGLTPGRYYVRTSSERILADIWEASGYVHELFGNKPCFGRRANTPCDVTAGTAVDVAGGATATNIDFELETGGAITGYMVDAATNGRATEFLLGQAISFGSYKVEVFDSNGVLVDVDAPTSSFTLGRVNYSSRGLPAGNYFVRATIKGFLDQTFDRRSCTTPPCSVTSGTPVVVALTQTSRADFFLDAAGSISGVLRESTGTALKGVTVVAHDAGGSEFGSAVTSDGGQFVIKAVPSGTYFVRTASSTHINQAYANRSCGSNCQATITSSTPIAVTTGVDSPGIDFALVRRTITATPATLHFGATKTGTTLIAVTAPQELVVDFTADAGAWTATANRSWLQVTQSSGSGPGRFHASIINPSDVIGARPLQYAAITLTPSSSGLESIVIPVTLTVQSSAATIAPFGAFDTPANGATVAGSIVLSGWALDDVGIERVELWRDVMAGETTPPYAGGGPGAGKIFIADAFFVSGARADIVTQYPTAPESNRAGWGYLLLTQGLWNQGNGTVTLHAFAYDKEGRSGTLGSKTITVNNATAAKPFGSIDTPGYGETVTGNFWNFGWALTPNATPSCAIPADGVRVSVDSGPLQPVTYGDLRNDIASAFPGYTNSGGAGGAYFIDITALSNGPHSIGWYVVDSCGRAEGIGSRFFNVLKQGSGISDQGSAIGDPFDFAQGKQGSRNRDQGSAVRASAAGPSRIVIKQGERIQLPLGGVGPYAGFQIVNGARHPLPIGSSLDAERGVFFWQPGPGFLGAHDLEFTSASDVIQLRIIVGTAVQAVIDTPASGDVDSSFTVAGWAIDEAAREGTGIDTVHVWAYPAAGGEPIFVGVAEIGGERPDIASLFGDQFAPSSYSLDVTLASGEYDVVVYPHSAVAGDFHGAKVVRVVVP